MGYKPDKNGASSIQVLTCLFTQYRGQRHFYLSLTGVISYYVFVGKAVNAGQHNCTLTTQSRGFYPESLWIGKTLTVQRIEHFVLFCCAEGHLVQSKYSSVNVYGIPGVAEKPTL